MAKLFKDTLSHSAINTLNECPRKFYLHYKEKWREHEEKSYFLWGDAMDQAVGASLDPESEKTSLELFSEIWATAKDKEMAYKTTKAYSETWDSLHDHGLMMLQKFEDEHKFRFQGDITLQQELSVPKDDVYGVGVIGYSDIIADVTDEHGNNPVRTLVDVKTSASTATFKRYKNLEKDEQLTLYFAILEAQGTPVDQVAFLVFSKQTKKIEWFFSKRNKKDIADARERVHFAKNVLTSGIFPPNYGACDNYSGCAFKPICAGCPKSVISKTLYQKKDEEV